MVSMFALSSCNDALEILPEDNIPAEVAFQSVADLQNGLNAIYRQYSPFNTIDYGSTFTDDTKIGADNGGQKVAFHNWVLNPGSAEAQNMWLNDYATINSINRVLAAAETITPLESQQQQYNKILGDCYALRAFLHLELLSYYGVSFDAAAPGIPYSDFVVVFEQLPRLTTGEVFERINEDLDTAFDLIDPSYTDVGYVTRDFVTAMRARTALYSGNSAQGLAATQTLIAEYPLADQLQYVNMFGDDSDNTEVIFKLYRIAGTNDQIIGGVWYFTGTGGAFLEMSNEFYDLISANPSDIRFPVNVDLATTDPANNVHNIGKYLGKGGFNYINDIKVFRVSEMYLIRAELLAKGGDYNGAALLLKQVRDARTGSSTVQSSFSTLQAAINEILIERQKELAYEGHRFVDVRRTNSITNAGFERADADCGGGTPCSLAASDNRFVFPIPLAETNGNTVIEQAPGYN